MLPQYPLWLEKTIANVNVYRIILLVNSYSIDTWKNCDDNFHRSYFLKTAIFCMQTSEIEKKDFHGEFLLVPYGQHA